MVLKVDLDIAVCIDSVVISLSCEAVSADVGVGVIIVLVALYVVDGEKDI